MLAGLKNRLAHDTYCVPLVCHFVFTFILGSIMNAKQSILKTYLPSRHITLNRRCFNAVCPLGIFLHKSIVNMG